MSATRAIFIEKNFLGNIQFFLIKIIDSYSGILYTLFPVVSKTSGFICKINAL